MRDPDVTVCIATFRRPAGLARLLESLARQKLPPSVWVEILVVDNDAANEVRAELEGRDLGPHPVGWLVEPSRNIAHARNRALEHARGRWLAFIDDDEEAEEGWLAAYLESADRFECDGWFGPVLPRLEAVVTPWLDVEEFYSRPRHPSGTPLDRADLRTSNALVRRTLFDGHHFDPAFGRSGGSDAELFGRMLDRGAVFAWCDEAQVVETVPRERHRLAWLSRRAFRGGASHTRIERRRRPFATPFAAARALAAACALLLALPFSFVGGRRAAARVWLRLCVQAGHLWSHAGRSFEEYA